VFLLFLFSCRNQDNSEALRAINRSLSKANEVLAANNETVYWTLNRKLNDSRTAPKAGLWEPPALAVKKLSAEVNKYVDSLKQRLSALKNNDERGVRELYEKEEVKLYGKLVKYAAEIVNVLNPTVFSAYPSLHQRLKKDKEDFRKEIAERLNIKPDSLSESFNIPVNWGSNYFEHSMPLQALIMLNKIQCDVLLAASILMYYCSNQVGSMDNYFTVFHIIATLDSKHVKSGQTIEVNAGVGEFNRLTRQSIEIDGVVRNANDEGLVVHSFRAVGKPGKYYIPVKIMYTRPDGITDTISKKLEYIIAK